MPTVEELTAETFPSVIQDGVVLVDFWAPWCGPCRPQGKIVQEVADSVDDSVRVAKLNLDDAPDLARLFDIRAIPTVVIFNNGIPARRFVGVTMAHDLLSAVEEMVVARM